MLIQNYRASSKRGLVTMGITGKPQKNKNSQERRVTLPPARSVSPLSETQQSNKPKGSGPNTNKYIPGDKGRWSIASCLTCNVQITPTYGIDVQQEKKLLGKEGTHAAMWNMSIVTAVPKWHRKIL